VDAYLSDAMTLLGNVDLGRKIILHLAGSGTQSALALLARSSSSLTRAGRLNGVGGGSLTLSGEFFTRGGIVDIHYDVERVYIDRLLLQIRTVIYSRIPFQSNHRVMENAMFDSLIAAL
jgi:hypothetical protein